MKQSLSEKLNVYARKYIADYAVRVDRELRKVLAQGYNPKTIRIRYHQPKQHTKPDGRFVWSQRVSIERRAVGRHPRKVLAAFHVGYTLRIT